MREKNIQRNIDKYDTGRNIHQDDDGRLKNAYG